MIVNIFPLFFISIASFLNIFSYGYLPNILFESFILIQSIFIYLLSFSYKINFKLPNSIKKFLFVNFFFLLISSIIQTAFFPISISFALFLGVTSFYVLGLNISKKHLFLFIKFLICCFYFGVFLCLISERISLYQYTGFFGGPNNLGRFFSYFCIIFSGFLIKYQKDITYFFAFQNYLAILISFFFLSISFSRTAIVASLLPFIFYFLYRLILKFKLFLSTKRKKDFYSIVSGLLIMLIIVILGIYYYEFVSSKTVFKLLQRGDASGGRFLIWAATLQQISNWGIDLYGTKLEFLEFIGGEPHNTYLNFALKNGAIPSIVYYSSLVFTIISETLFKKNNREGNYLFVFILSIYIFVYFMFETASSILPFWLIFFFLAYEKRENISYKVT